LTAKLSEDIMEDRVGKSQMRNFILTLLTGGKKHE